MEGKTSEEKEEKWGSKGLAAKSRGPNEIRWLLVECLFGVRQRQSGSEWMEAVPTGD